MLSSAPVLSPAEQVYQRLLADNREEVIEIAKEYVAGSGALSFYDQLGLPAIAMADSTAIKDPQWKTASALRPAWRQ